MNALVHKRPVVQAILTIGCLLLGMALGSAIGIYYLNEPQKETDTSTQTLPDQDDWLDAPTLPLIQSECQEPRYLEQQVRTLRKRHYSMEEIESEIMIERLESVEKSIRDLNNYYQEPH